jgi:hypothetical protein
MQKVREVGDVRVSQRVGERLWSDLGYMTRERFEELREQLPAGDVIIDWVVTQSEISYQNAVWQGD